MPSQLSWTEWFRWIYVLLWPASAWGALRMVTGWGYRPLPISRDRVGAFTAWLALTGCFGSVARLALHVLGSGFGYVWMLADVFGLSSGDFPFEGWFFPLIWAPATVISLGVALWIGLWLVRRIDWQRVGSDEALEAPKPSPSGWRTVYLSMALAASFPALTSVAGLLWLSTATSDPMEPAAVAGALASLASIVLAGWLAGGLVDDLLDSRLMRSDEAPPAQHLRLGLWVGACGLLVTGLWSIANAVLAIVDDQSGSSVGTTPTLALSLLRLSNLTYLALSILMFRLLPKPIAEWGPRHALRGLRRLIIALALASTMVWPFDFLQTGLDALADLRVGPAAARNLLYLGGVAVAIWLLTWRPKTQS